MSAFTTLREVNDRLKIDDAPLWAVALGLVFALGFYLRDLAHILVALATDEYPGLRNNDVTARSPVLALDDKALADFSARLVAVGFGIGLLYISLDSSRIAVKAYIIGNSVVPLSDLVLFWASYKNT